MDLGLRERVAVVTGASRGIGKAIAMSLAAEGCKLSICARGEEGLAEAASELESIGAEVLATATDVTAPDAAERLVDVTVERFGQVDVVVSNVGGNRRGNFVETSEADWDAVLNLNLTSHGRLSRRVIPHMQARKSGVIIFVASIFGREAGGKGLSIYNTTKAALISLAKIMALELAPDGIRVLSIAPGSIRFPGGSWDRRCNEDPDGMARFIEENLPLGRFGAAEEVGDTVAFLASDRASLITGACLNVDGGQSRSLI